MKKKFTFIELIIVVAIIVLLFGATVMPFIHAKMESETYNRLTGAHTIWWDALWVELRVQDAPRNDIWHINKVNFVYFLNTGDLNINK